MATSAHPADDDRIFFKEARSLVKAGAEVTVLCASDKKFPEKTEGVRFEHHQGRGGLKNRAIALSSLQQAIKRRPYDVVHCHEPDSLLAALSVKQSTGVKVIFDSHEMWGGIFAGRLHKSTWKMAQAGYQLFERELIGRCDGAIGASLAISDFLAKSLPRQRVATLYNVPVVEVFGEQPTPALSAKIRLCHDGHLTFNRGLKTMAEAVRQVAQDLPIEFRIVGDVFGEEREWLDTFVRENKLEQVIHRTGWLPYDNVGEALSDCHVGLVALEPTPNNMIAAPNKIFNYLLYGMPVLAPSYPSSHFSVLANEGAALLNEPGSAEALAQSIRSLVTRPELLGDMANTALSLSKQKYRWHHMEPVLFYLYDSVLEHKNG